MRSHPNNLIVGFIITLISTSACSNKDVDRPKKYDDMGLIGLSTHNCMSEEKLNSLLKSPTTKDVIWKIANHYTMCAQDYKSAEPWLRKLVNMGDPEAMVLLATYLKGSGRRDEAIEYARQAAQLGYPSGKALLKELHQDR